MAEEGTLAIRQDVLDECGANANDTYTAEAYTNRFIKKAEGYISALSNYDWVDNYSSVTTEGAEFLRNLVSQMAAIKVIKQDMSGFTSRQEVVTMLNVLYEDVDNSLEILKNTDIKRFIGKV